MIAPENAQTESSGLDAEQRAEIEADFEWRIEHDAELLRQYRGQWIAIWKKQVIASGASAVDVARHADRVAPPDAYALVLMEDYPDLLGALL